MYDLPFLAKSNGWVRTVAGGWRAGTIISLQTGPATGISYGVDTTNTGQGSRPDQIGPAALAGSQRSLARWFNTAAFAPPPSYTTCGSCGRFGNSARAVLHNPGSETVDLILTKTFRITERAQFDFRAEAFNSFNHVNPGSANVTLTSSAFGTIGSAYSPRIVQFGGKLVF